MLPPFKNGGTQLQKCIYHRMCNYPFNAQGCQPSLTRSLSPHWLACSKRCWHFLWAIVCPWLDFDLPPRCRQVVWRHRGEIEPFYATLAQDRFAECDKLGKNLFKYSLTARIEPEPQRRQIFIFSLTELWWLTDHTLPACPPWTSMAKNGLISFQGHHTATDSQWGRMLLSPLWLARFRQRCYGCS